MTKISFKTYLNIETFYTLLNEKLNEFTLYKYFFNFLK